VTADNQKAHIEQGTEIPYVTPGSANSPATVAFKKAVLRLEVTPQITPDNRIIMTVEVRKDNVGQFVDLGGGFRVPSIDTRNVTTQIHVNNGDTAVIGGIFEETITNDVTKVPILGDIPFFAICSRRRAVSVTSRNADLPHPRVVKKRSTRSSDASKSAARRAIKSCVIPANTVVSTVGEARRPRVAARSPTRSSSGKASRRPGSRTDAAS
jgi:hypothetical protein